MLLSNSELETYQRCRRKWWFGYYRGLALRRDEVTGPRGIGNRVHRALAAYYERQIDPLLLLQAEINADAEAIPDQASEIAKEGDLCMAMIEGYLEYLATEGVDEDLEFIEAEREVRQPLGEVHGEMVTLVGTLDARFRRRSDGARLFMDHKSVQSFPDTIKIARIAQQFLHYDLLEYLEYLRDKRSLDERTDGGIYNMLRKVKRTARANPPFYMRHEVRHNLDELRSYWTRVAAISAELIIKRRQLDNGDNPRMIVYPTPNANCSWSCDFFPVCPLVDDGSDVEAVIESLYEVREPRYAAKEESTEQ